MGDSYSSRVVDGELKRRLAASGGVLIEGPRAVGKTQTARQLAASEALLDTDERYQQAAALDPSIVLRGDVPRLIDEWQVEPRIWNHVRREIDDRRASGQFILTGSASPADDLTRHSGAGRISRMRMRPMSLFECGVSSGEVSLEALLNGEPSRTAGADFGLEDVATEIVTGGWPGLRALSRSTGGEAMRDYLEEVTHLDLTLPGLPRHDPSRVERLMRSIARNTASEAGASTLSKDSGDEENPPLSEDSARAYVAALERIFIVEEQPTWAPHLRSKYWLRKTPKLHFVDPCLAVAALHTSSDALLGDLNFLGLLFESLVVRDMRVYAQARGARVLHYRDSDELEADIIVEHPDGRWAAFEVKLGYGYADDAARNLLKLASRVDTSRCGEPAVLGVVVPGGLGFRRKDGVDVIPLNALCP